MTTMTTTKMPAMRTLAVARAAAVPAVDTAVPAVDTAVPAIAWGHGSANACGTPATFKRLDPGRLGATT